MKLITLVDSYKTPKDEVRYRFWFDDDDRPLILSSLAFKEGAKLPEEMLEPKETGGYKYYVLRHDNKPTPTGGGRSPTESPERTRSMCLSYAKDLAVADRITVKAIIKQAEEFYQWVIGQSTIEN